MSGSLRTGLSSLDWAVDDPEPAEASNDEPPCSWFDTLTTSDVAPESEPAARTPAQMIAIAGISGARRRLIARRPASSETERGGGRSGTRVETVRAHRCGAARLPAGSAPEHCLAPGAPP